MSPVVAVDWVPPMHVPARLPLRTDEPYCAACGMTVPHHWKGCPDATHVHR